jgi:hypothetical protein
MNKRIFITTIVICVFLFAMYHPAGAQNKRIGTASATQLLIPVGGRDLAMGGSSIATTGGVEAVYWNPAGFGIMKTNAEGMFSRMSYIADIGVSYGVAGVQFGSFGSMALSIKALDFGDIPMTTNDDPDGLSGRTYSPTFVTVGLTYARSLTDAISAGGTVKIVSEEIARVSASAVAFDFGVQYRNLANVPGLDLGVTIKNIGQQMQYDGPGLYRDAVPTESNRPEQKFKSEAASFELPSIVEIGLGFRRRFTDNVLLGLTGTFSNNNLYSDEYKVGGEIGYILSPSIELYGRAGYGFTSQLENSDDEIFGVTFGVGLYYATAGMDITVDYAYRQVEFFNNNNVISVKLGF